MVSVAKDACKEPKTTVKRAKNALTVHVPENTPSNDRDRIKSIANLLLEHLESNVKKRKARTPEMEEARTEKYETLFGKKNSVDSLVTLADLLMKLETPPAPENSGQLPGYEELKMNDADLALVEHFVDRVRGRKEI